MRKLNELTTLQAIVGLKSGEFKSIDLVEACLSAINKYDSKIRAYITVTGDLAREKAGEADKEIQLKKEKAFAEKPLLGIPYACKDNYSTKGIETTASSNILKGYIPPYESTVTTKLKEAGAILLGKTNMDAFAHGASTETSDFFTTHNPWDLERVPGGSSGGSAAAVAAHMCIFAIGSDTGGSIRCPASWSGVTGLKPTYGRVSRYGLIAMASSTDSPGPMTKTVEDAALILKVIAGKDPYDATTSSEEVPNYLTEFKSVKLKGLKIGKPKSYFDIDFEPGVKKAVEESVEIFKHNGAEIIDIDLLDPKYSIAIYTIVQRSEVSSNLARFDGIRYGHTRDHFGFEAKKRMMLGSYTLSSGYYDAYYSKAQKVRTLIIEDFKKAFEKADLIIGPTMPSIAYKIGSKADLFGELTDMMQLPASMAGLCAVAIPGGFSEGMPVGIQLIGEQLAETKVLGAAHSFQQVSDFHVKFPDLEKYYV